MSKLGECSKCNNKRYIVNKKHMMCQQCNKERLNGGKKKISVKSRFKNRRKPTGELSLFKAIWETRPHLCQVSGVKLHQFDIRMFSHLLAKGAYPSFRLYEKNIWLVHPDIHHQWEFKAHSELPSIFAEKLKLKEELKREYYGIQNEEARQE